LIRQGSTLTWAAVVVMTLSAWLVMAPLGALLSAWFPRRADLSRIGTGSNPSGVAGLLGFLASTLAVGTPTLMGTLAHLLSGPGAALAVVTGWLAVCLGLHVLLMKAAARALEARRENLALAASSR
jgi:hypothetical protein